MCGLQDNPTYVFRSDKMDLTLELTDDYSARNQMLAQLQRDANNWFELALGRAPVELHATLQVRVAASAHQMWSDSWTQKYLSGNPTVSLADPSDLGPTIAVDFVKAYGPINRHLASLSSMLGAHAQYDRAKVAAAQLTSKAYFSGEASGFHIARMMGKRNPYVYSPVPELTLVVLDPKTDDTQTSPQEVRLLKSRMAESIREITEKRSTLTIRDLKRLLFRCAAAIISLDKVCPLACPANRKFSPSSSSTVGWYTTWLHCHSKRSILLLSLRVSRHGRGLFRRSPNTKSSSCLS